MRKARNLLRRTVSLVLAVSLLMTVLSTGVFAADTDSDTVTDPVALNVSMNETRSYITIKFDREVEAAVSALQNKIRISKNGGSPATISSSSTVTVSGDCIHIKLPSALTTKNNYFTISAGALVGQTDVIETPVFDAADPALLASDSVVLNSSQQTVTLKFDSKISGFPNDTSLKNGYIELARNGSTYNEIIPEEDITINGEKGEIVIYLPTWLSGKYSRFRITSGKLQNTETGNINLSNIVTPSIDATKTSAAPEIDYTTITSDRSSVTIYFTDKIKNSYSGVSSSVALSLLKSHIWVSRGSTDNYETLGGADTLTVGSNYIKINFDTPLSASRNYIKIDAGSLTDYYGYTPSDTIITENITSGASSSSLVPSYASALLSSNNHIVIYFTTSIKRNPSITSSELLSNIYVSRNGGSYKALTNNGSVSFSDNKMTITLKEPLSGSNNRVKIYGNSISSAAGAVLTTTVTTSSLEAGMDSENDNNYSENYPEYSHVVYDSSAQRVKIYFKNDIRVVSSASLLDDIYISRNGNSYTSLSSGDVASISPSNVITILLAKPLTGTRNSFRINKGTIADSDSGYVQNSTITTDYISVSENTSSDSSTTSDYSGDVFASLSADFYTITLKFNEPIYNGEDSLEDLKSKIQISRNGYFETLSSDDYIRLDSASNELLIVLAKPADEFFSQIKILSGALQDSNGNTIAKTITTLPLGEADGDVRTYINETAVEGIATAQAAGDSTIVSISGLAKFNAYTKAIELLVKVPSSSESATLNISGDIVEVIKRYGGTIGLSLDNATYFIPASNISSISSGDTLSITIADSSSSVSQKLASAATKDSFAIEASSKKLNAKIITSTGSNAEITHTLFAKKRFLLTNPGSNKTAFTAVRIENSGSVVPVPTVAEVTGGVVYLNANTLKDGDYAAISSSRTLQVPTWVQAPTNMLASRLILTNTTGSNINGNEAITRSETVTIMARTLGILSDMNGASPFFDMISTDSYFNAVMSTVSYELISGYPDSTFKPSNRLTRAEAMTIVARAIRFMNGKSVSESSDMTLDEATRIISKFTDAGTVDNWAKVDIAECVQAGVVNGDNKGRLNPKANVTRAELIQLMYNVLSNADML